MRNKCILDWTETKGDLLNLSSPPFVTPWPPHTRLRSSPHVWADCASSFCQAQICYAGERSRICWFRLSWSTGRLVTTSVKLQNPFFASIQAEIWWLGGTYYSEVFYSSCETANQTLLKSTKLKLTHDWLYWHTKSRFPLKTGLFQLCPNSSQLVNLRHRQPSVQWSFCSFPHVHVFSMAKTRWEWFTS